MANGCCVNGRFVIDEPDMKLNISAALMNKRSHFLPVLLCLSFMNRSIHFKTHWNPAGCVTVSPSPLLVTVGVSTVRA